MPTVHFRTQDVRLRTASLFPPRSCLHGTGPATTGPVAQSGSRLVYGLPRSRLSGEQSRLTKGYCTELPADRPPVSAGRRFLISAALLDALLCRSRAKRPECRNFSDLHGDHSWRPKAALFNCEQKVSATARRRTVLARKLFVPPWTGFRSGPGGERKNIWPVLGRR